ncbi:MAG TPA: hypothetical protein VGM56_07145 [Byssovorax sp.]
MRLVPSLLLAVVLVSSSACKHAYDVGDHVWVEWEKDKKYPGVILPNPQNRGKYRIHFDGYDAIWDEEVTRDRIKGLVEGTPESVPEPPEKVRTKAMQAAQTNLYKIGDQVRVEWHGTMYAARVTGIVGQERYRVHYDGYGSEWDETVGLPRIQPK